VPGPASSTFNRTPALSAMRRSCEAAGSPTRARNTSWARVISSPEGRRRRSRSPAAAARSASGRHRRAWPQRDPAAPAGGGGRLQFGSIVAHRFDTNGWNRRVSPVAPRPCEGPLTEPTAGAQPWPRERVLMPHTCRSRYPSGSAQLGGNRTFMRAGLRPPDGPKAADVNRVTRAPIRALDIRARQRFRGDNRTFARRRDGCGGKLSDPHNYLL
jgi:hypothetical protein